MSVSLPELKALVVALMRRHGVVHASVFGSTARGDATGESDVDFLVEFEEGRSLLDLASLRLELAQVLNRSVDVATSGSLHPRIRPQVEQDMVVLM